MDVIDAIQVAIYNKLTESGYNVEDIPTKDTPFPFVKMSDVSYSKENDKRGNVGYDVNYEIHVWNKLDDKQVSNYISAHVAELLLEIYLDSYDVIVVDTDIVRNTDYLDGRQTTINLNLKLDRRR